MSRPPTAAAFRRWSELLDVEVDQLAGTGALVAAHRLGRRQVARPVETEPAENPAEGGGRDALLRGDALARPSHTAQRSDPVHLRRRRRPMEPVWPRGAIAQPGGAFSLEADHPLAHRAPSWSRPRSRMRPARPPGARPEPCAPAPLDCAASSEHSHGCSSGPPSGTEASQLQPLRLDPDGQPDESSQLAAAEGRPHVRNDALTAMQASLVRR